MENIVSVGRRLGPLGRPPLFVNPASDEMALLIVDLSMN